MTTKAISSLAVGSSVYLNVGGGRTEFLIVHQGLPSSLYDTSCNGTWLLMKDCYASSTWHSSTQNIYETSAVNAYLNGDFYNLFDPDIQSIIKQVKIPYRKNGGSNGTDQSGANGLLCKIFLLSGYEVGWTTSDYSGIPVDGAKLAYFESGTGTSANNRRIAHRNGTAIGWWTRSPNTGSSSKLTLVYTNGNRGSVSAFPAAYGVRPALVLPSNVLVDDSGNVVIPDLTAHKTLVGGTAYTVKSGKCMVGGTVYNIKKGRTLIGGTGYDITFAPAYDPVFANNTWEQIIEACHNNEVPDTWKVADQKPMTINGVDYLIDIIGKNHDTYTAGGKAPLTFQLHDCYADTKQMNSSDTSRSGWTSCAMRQTHLPAILALMPIEVQNGIREVNKRTMLSSSILPKTTADKLFLLSEIEIFGSVTYSYKGEGTQYDYYKADNNNKKKTRNGIEADWWERSPDNSDSEKFCLAGLNGIADAYFASEEMSVSFGFCF